MSDQVQTFFRNKEGFGFSGYNNQLVRIWNDPHFENKWNITYPTRKTWKLDRIFDQKGEKLNNQNCSVSFWMFVNKNSGNWNHIISLRSPTIDRYLGIWIRPNLPGIHIRSTTDKAWNSGDDYQGDETGYYNKNEDNNSFPLNRAIFVTVTLETPNPSPEQLKINPDKQLRSTYRLYIDGVHKNTHVHTGTVKSLQEDDQSYIMVGRKYGGRGFHNYALKDIHLYNHVINESDIQNLYNAVKHQNDPDGAKSLFTVENFDVMNDSKEGFQSKTEEGFLTASQCAKVVMPAYKSYFDFYKNVKMLNSNGKACKYSYSGRTESKTVQVGPHPGGSGPKIVNLASQGIGKDDEIDPTPTNSMNPRWNDTFRLEREGANRETLKVYRVDPNYGSSETTAGWGMNLTFETRSNFSKSTIDWEQYYDRYRGTPRNPDFVANRLPRTLDAVWNHWNTYGKREGRIMKLKDQSEATCGSSKPICVDHVPNAQYGLCGREGLPFVYNGEKVVLWEHNNSGWKVELAPSRIPDMSNHNGKNLRGLSTIDIPAGLKVIIFDETLFSGNRKVLNGPQKVYLWQQKLNGTQFNDRVRSLKVKLDGFRFKTTYNNDPSNPVQNEDDWRLDKDDLKIEDTLDKHFSMDGPKKKMRFIEFESNADWRKGTRAHANLPYDEANELTRDKKFSRLDFRNMQIFLGDNGMTFCMWFKCKADNNEQWARLFDLGNGYNKENIVMAFDAKELKCHVSDARGSYTSQTIITSVNNNEWYHVAWVIGKPDANDKCEWKIYVNGVCTNENKIPNQNYPPHKTGDNRIIRKNMYLGASNYWWDPHFNGCIADVRIYKDPLNAGEVCNVYNNPDPQDGTG